MFQIKITKLPELEAGETNPIELFSATVEELDLAPLVAMVYRPKRKPRADAGTKRAKP